jgi:CRISPR/Cas system-associated protein Cas5 (RAMP superfamily)
MFRRQKFSVGAIVRGAVAAAKAANQTGKAGLKAKKKIDKINKKDTLAFGLKYRKMMNIKKALNKPAVQEYEKTMKAIKSNPGYTGRRKMDIEAELNANKKLQSKLFKDSKDLAKKYEGLPDIRSRFRGAPGRQRKLVKGVKNPMKRAEILQEDRLKRGFKDAGKKK